MTESLEVNVIDAVLVRRASPIEHDEESRLALLGVAA
jgi:hypothetical protein